jgi:hypothetical protein
MAYVDHAFSISDDPTETYIVNNKPPIKEIAFAIALLSLGTLGFMCGIGMAVSKVGGDRGHGKLFSSLQQALSFPPGSLVNLIVLNLQAL